MACDETSRALTSDGAPTQDVFVAGDAARWPHPLYPGELLRLDHWDNAVTQARTAAHNMAHDAHRIHQPLPAFWSNQFGINLKCVGLPALADQVAVTQGSLDERSFVAAYGRQGRLVAAVAVDSPRVLDGYAALIQARAPFPPELNAPDGPAQLKPCDAEFPRTTRREHDAPPAALSADQQGTPA